ncbi:28S ribosomal protein S23, mitochondrial [Zootermopsis nevadensis]|uniref:Small ribosomal subunit protein mS23 n=1 Tax=Zootermopsis nevadensis TaxID=136037 RepID=A0A067R5F4_ZOONE|nr:28S ribosomal protein S23, mitochondrial [Zootermopsis nevadensis]KDR18398.1 28S ribosomal protein S23, mitochondrial [Zootermopsis nevadensis]
MASSRLEKIGTIYSRVRGLLRSGAMRQEDKPIWYDIYKAFPPKYEPRYDRPAPDVPLRSLFYPEDIIRAKFHKQHKSLPAVNLSDQHIPTQTQKFISTYNKLREEGKTVEENLYAAAVDVLNDERQNAVNVPKAETNSLASSFQDAQRDANVNIKDIFKD